MWFIGRIIYQPSTSWPILLPIVRWYVERTEKAAAASNPIHGSASSTYGSFMLYFHARFPSDLCILSVVVFACGFPEESGLFLIPYSFSINLFLNLWPRNYPPRSYVISTGHGYRTSHVVSTKFTIAIAFLSLYYVISNHPVTGSIIVTYFKIRGSFPFLHIL